MTIFEYLLVLYSVILSLGLAHLVTGVGELLRSRAVIRWSLPYVLWLAYAVGAILDIWTGAWLLRDQDQWSFLSILLLLGLALPVYLATLWLIPSRIGDDPIDLQAFLVQERHRVLGAFIAYVVVGILWNISLMPSGRFDFASLYIGGPSLLILMLAFWSRNRLVQLLAPLFGVALQAIYFATYFPTIR